MYIVDFNAISPILLDKNGRLPDHFNCAPTLKLLAKEQVNHLNIPKNMLRRMGKATRFGIGSALPLLENNNITPDGIIIGTALGGMEHCIQFLNQIIDYDEGLLTPTNFVQSTSNAPAGTLGLMTKNTGYNTTHVCGGLSFEGALLDAFATIKLNEAQNILVGNVEELSNYNFNIDSLSGLFKSKPIAPSHLLDSKTPGTISGEGSAMFIASKSPHKAKIIVDDINTITTKNDQTIKDWLDYNIRNAANATSHLIVGRNGDFRTDYLYNHLEKTLSHASLIAYKHLVGEYQTSTGFALWLANYLSKFQDLPGDFYINKIRHKPKQIIIYNHFKGESHSIIKISVP